MKNYQLCKDCIIKVEKSFTVQWLADSSVKPGEGLCVGYVPDLQRIAAYQLI